MKGPGFTQKTPKGIKPMNAHDVGLHVTNGPVKPTGDPMKKVAAPHFAKAQLSIVAKRTP